MADPIPHRTHIVWENEESAIIAVDAPEGPYLVALKKIRDILGNLHYEVAVNQGPILTVAIPDLAAEAAKLPEWWPLKYREAQRTGEPRHDDPLSSRYREKKMENQELRDLLSAAGILSRNSLLTEAEQLVRVVERRLGCEGREIEDDGSIPLDILESIKGFRTGFTDLRGAGWRGQPENIESDLRKIVDGWVGDVPQEFYASRTEDGMELAREVWRLAQRRAAS